MECILKKRQIHYNKRGKQIIKNETDAGLSLRGCGFANCGIP